MPWTFEPPSTPPPVGMAWILDALRRLRTAFALVESLTVGRRDVEQGLASPSVAGARLLRTANSSPVNVTSFREGYPGQHLTLLFTDANTTLVHGTTLQLAGSVNYTGTVGATRAFVTYDGTVWLQVPRG